MATSGNSSSDGTRNGNGDWTAKYGSILQTVIVMSIPFTALWIGAISPMISNQEKLLTLREHDEYRRSEDIRIVALESEMLRVRATAATKDELARQEQSAAARAAGQATRLMKIDDERHGSSNRGKSIDRIQEHLNEIDRRILGVVTKP